MTVNFSRKNLNSTVLCILGNLILGLGVAMCKLSAFGTDPFNSLCMSVSGFLNISYPLFTWIFNLTLFLFEIIWGRRYIHIGTFVNWFLLSYAANIFLKLFRLVSGQNEISGIPLRAVFLFVGLIAIAFGLALYQYADLGVAPYDAIPLMLVARFPKLKFFMVRVALDGSAVIISLLAGGIAMKNLGIGTALTALCLGPFVNIFNLLLFGKRKNKA